MSENIVVCSVGPEMSDLTVTKFGMYNRVGEKDTKVLIFQNNTQGQVRLSMKTP